MEYFGFLNIDFNLVHRSVFSLFDTIVHPIQGTKATQSRGLPNEIVIINFQKRENKTINKESI